MSTTTENGWTKEWPEINGFYWLRGWRHYADLPIKVDGDEFWMMFNLAANHRMDLSDSEGVEFLGPFTASDFEQLAALRKATGDALKFMEKWFGEHSARKLPGDQELIAALREALKQGEKS